MSKKERKVFIETHAFNEEKRLARAVESVLCQTHSNFEYYLIDHGSTDGTRAIIGEYARKDKRIKPYYYFKNRSYNFYSFLDNIIAAVNPRAADGDRFVYLCADDKIEADFFEKMLRFMDENGLDTAACRSNFTDVKTGEIKNRINISHPLIIEGDGFDSLFPRYFPYFRDLWATMTKMSLLRQRSDLFVTASGYTFLPLLLELLGAAGKAGVLNDALHTYYVSDHSLLRARTINFSRVKYNLDFCGLLREYLLNKCGVISEENYAFIYRKYFNMVANHFPIIINAESNALAESGAVELERCKIYALHAIVTSPYFSGMLCSGAVSDEDCGCLRQTIIDGIQKILLSDKRTASGDFLTAPFSFNSKNYGADKLSPIKCVTDIYKVLRG
jgi:glycosyltransferase involved in cell wall biosynthesis